MGGGPLGLAGLSRARKEKGMKRRGSHGLQGCFGPGSRIHEDLSHRGARSNAQARTSGNTHGTSCSIAPHRSSCHGAPRHAISNDWRKLCARFDSHFRMKCVSRAKLLLLGIWGSGFSFGCEGME